MLLGSHSKDLLAFGLICEIDPPYVIFAPHDYEFNAVKRRMVLRRILG